MYGSNIRKGTVIGGKTVLRTTPGSETLWYRPSMHGPAVVNGSRKVVHVVFTDGSKATFGTDDRIDATGYTNGLTAGHVSSRIGSATKVRVSRKDWRGEHVHGMTTAAHDTWANTPAYDMGRVNGTHGVAR